MELKLYVEIKEETSFGGSNRTFMELKLGSRPVPGSMAAF